MNYKPPSRALFRTLRIIALPVFKLIFRYQRHVDPALKEIKGASLIIGNHGNYIDPVFLALAVPHQCVNFVAGSVLMKKRWTRKLMSFVQVIPKLQFVTDTRAVRAMIEIIKQDGTLALFPEARRSLNGASEPFDIATAKLVKKYKLNVIAVRTNGAYLSWPRWSKALFKPGHVESTSTLLLKSDEISKYSAEELNSIFMRALNGNDFTWQEKRKKKAKYHSRKRALGLERLLHRCPNCHQDLVMRSTERSLYCSSCSYEVRLGRDMLFYPGHKSSESTKLYCPSIYDWHHWQRSVSASLRFDQGESWSCPARIVELDYGDDPETGLSMLFETGEESHGSVTLSRDLLSFDTTDSTKTNLNVRIKLTGDGQQVFTNFAYIQMPSNGKIYNVFPDEALNNIRIVDWVESIAEGALNTL